MKKSKILGLLAISTVMLTGCVDAMPDMTAEQSDLVAEYAAGLLLKYSPNYDYRLVSDEELAEALAQETAVDEAETDTEKEASASEETVQDKEKTAQEETETVLQTEQTGISFADVDADLAVALGLDEGVSLHYQSFEICASYPQEASGFSGVDAGEGRKLLVLHFDLENSTDEKMDCQLADAALKLRINVNQSLSTGVMDLLLLPDDMISFSGSMEAGEKVDVTAVAEIEDMSDEDIESLTIQMSSLNGSCNVKVR